ncbi:MAG: hypothetical protein ACE365_05750 [Gammaproteobacteria bacterium]
MFARNEIENEATNNTEIKLLKDFLRDYEHALETRAWLQLPGLHRDNKLAEVRLARAILNSHFFDRSTKLILMRAWAGAQGGRLANFFIPELRSLHETLFALCPFPYDENQNANKEGFVEKLKNVIANWRWPFGKKGFLTRFIQRISNLKFTKAFTGFGLIRGYRHHDDVLRESVKLSSVWAEEHDLSERAQALRDCLEDEEATQKSIEEVQPEPDIEMPPHLQRLKTLINDAKKSRHYRVAKTLPDEMECLIRKLVKNKQRVHDLHANINDSSYEDSIDYFSRVKEYWSDVSISVLVEREKSCYASRQPCWEVVASLEYLIRLIESLEEKTRYLLQSIDDALFLNGLSDDRCNEIRQSILEFEASSQDFTEGLYEIEQRMVGNYSDFNAWVSRRREASVLSLDARCDEILSQMTSEQGSFFSDLFGKKKNALTNSAKVSFMPLLYDFQKIFWKYFPEITNITRQYNDGELVYSKNFKLEMFAISDPFFDAQTDIIPFARAYGFAASVCQSSRNSVLFFKCVTYLEPLLYENYKIDSQKRVCGEVKDLNDVELLSALTEWKGSLQVIDREEVKLRSKRVIKDADVPLHLWRRLLHFLPKKLFLKSVRKISSPLALPMLLALYQNRDPASVINNRSVESTGPLQAYVLMQHFVIRVYAEAFREDCTWLETISHDCVLHAKLFGDLTRLGCFFSLYDNSEEKEVLDFLSYVRERHKKIIQINDSIGRKIVHSVNGVFEEHAFDNDMPTPILVEISDFVSVCLVKEDPVNEHIFRTSHDAIDWVNRIMARLYEFKHSPMYKDHAKYLYKKIQETVLSVSDMISMTREVPCAFYSLDEGETLSNVCNGLVQGLIFCYASRSDCDDFLGCCGDFKSFDVVDKLQERNEALEHICIDVSLVHGYWLALQGLVHMQGEVVSAITYGVDRAHALTLEGRNHVVDAGDLENCGFFQFVEISTRSVRNKLGLYEYPSG